jgi:hypothetical protein
MVVEMTRLHERNVDVMEEPVGQGFEFGQGCPPKLDGKA